MITRTHDYTDANALRERSKLFPEQQSLRNQVATELKKSPILKRTWHIYAKKPVIEYALRYPEIGVVSPLPIVVDDLLDDNCQEASDNEVRTVWQWLRRLAH